MKKFFHILFEILLVIWQLPQELLGAILFIVTPHEKIDVDFSNTRLKCKFYFAIKKRWGVSLAHFIFLNPAHHGMWTVMHESGHQIQSRLLGPLYLFVIGIPSATGNLIDRFCHKKWETADRVNWYYNKLPWEHWANRIAGITYDLNKKKYIIY